MLVDCKLNSSASQETCHVMPCKIHHTGPAKVKEFFTPQQQPDGQSIAYFRGRKLKGHKIQLPAEYKGYIIHQQDQPNGSSSHFEEDEEDEEDFNAEIPRNNQKWKAINGFSEILVWGHEQSPDPLSDPWITGISDWLSLAHSIHDPVDTENDSVMEQNNHDSV